MSASAYIRVARENFKKCMTQRDKIKEYLHSKNIKADFYIDNGYGGHNVKRPGFQKLLKRIENKDVTDIVCCHPDRIARNVSHFTEFLEHCRKNNVSVHFVELDKIVSNFDMLQIFLLIDYVLDQIGQLECKKNSSSDPI